MSSPRSLSSFFRRAVATLAVAAVALAACSSGGDDDSANADNTKAATQKVDVPGADLTLKLASIDTQSAGPSLTLDDKTKVAVMNQTRKYVEEAVARPLLSGRTVSKSYTKLFGPTVVAAATHAPDRGALTDEGVGKVTGDVSAPASKVAMHALVGVDGVIQYIATDFTLNVKSKLGKRSLGINRTTELTFEKTPKGAWVVTAYRIKAVRKVGSGAATATTTTTKTVKP
jgi:hypothetical protein